MSTASTFGARSTCTVKEAAEFLGIGRDTAYRAAADGTIPTLRLGRRLIVPVPKLLSLVGATTDAPTPSSSTATASGDSLAQHD